mgnify:CR=1 FL=1
MHGLACGDAGRVEDGADDGQDEHLETPGALARERDRLGRGRRPDARDDRDPAGLDQVEDGGQIPDGITKVTGARIAKTGTGAKGEWTLYAVRFADGREATTFSASAFSAAQDAEAGDYLVDPRMSPGKKEGTWTLESLTPA